MVDQPLRVIAAACDGACSGNPGPGGWGALLRFEDGSQRELGGADPATTNNRMELKAALALLETLRDLPRHPDLVIRTDSRYLIDGLQKWLVGWKRKGWRTASGGQVLNRDLWEQLDRARLPDLTLIHVRGHSGDPDNDRCDTIAVAFARGQRPALAREGPQVPAASVAPRRAAGKPLILDVVPAEAPVPAQGDQASAELAPEPLVRLLGRLELAERLAAGGFSLTLVELAQVVELPLRSLEARQQAWPWRDWTVVPLDQGHWRLERDAGGLETRS
ncbi:MAG: ribonuclease HI [Cyanobacteria bacterium]|nr:ribonuclease HI [Cyanobacteriota bacterium]